MGSNYFKRGLLFSLVCLTCFVRLQRAEDSDDDGHWDIRSPELTEEIEQITQRPEPYKHTPPGFFPATEVTPPEAYYEAEYADKPCQDKAEGKIFAQQLDRKKIQKKNNEVIVKKNIVPEVIVDHLKIEKVDGAYKVQQKLVASDANNGDGVEKKLVDDGKQVPIGDIWKNNEDEQMNGNGIVDRENKITNGEQKNLEDLKEGKYEPIGDNVKPVDPSGNEQDLPKEILAEDSEKQINMKDVINDVKEEALDGNKKKSDQKMFEIVNDLKLAPNMKNLYNIAEEDNNPQEIAAVKNNEAKNVDKLSNGNEKSHIQNDLGHNDIKINEPVRSHLNKPESIGKAQVGNKNSVNDFQIKIKLERFDDAKSNLNKQVNSLVDLGRKSLSGFNTFQSLVNKMMPFAQNSFNLQNSLGSNLNPQNFYMKYLQIDPARNELKYEYYFFQKFVHNRYKSANAPRDDKLSSSVLMSKLLEQLLGPTSLLSNPLSYLSPLGSVRDRPVKIFMNEKSAAKYLKNQAKAEMVEHSRKKRDVQQEQVFQRVKRNASEELFNEGPFKVEDKAHLAWAKDFLKQFPKEERPTSYRVIHQQPSSTDALQWYHPFPGEEVTYYTIEPLATRTTAKGEPEDLCKCHHDWKTPEPREEDLIHRAGE